MKLYPSKRHDGPRPPLDTTTKWLLGAFLVLVVSAFVMVYRQASSPTVDRPNGRTRLTAGDGRTESAQATDDSSTQPPDSHAGLVQSFDVPDDDKGASISSLVRDGHITDPAGATYVGKEEQLAEFNRSPTDPKGQILRADTPLNALSIHQLFLPAAEWLNHLDVQHPSALICRVGGSTVLNGIYEKNNIYRDYRNYSPSVAAMNPGLDEHNLNKGDRILMWHKGLSVPSTPKTQSVSSAGLPNTSGAGTSPIVPVQAPDATGAFLRNMLIGLAAGLLVSAAFWRVISNRLDLMMRRIVRAETAGVIAAIASEASSPTEDLTSADQGTVSAAPQQPAASKRRRIWERAARRQDRIQQMEAEEARNIARAVEASVTLFAQARQPIVTASISGSKHDGVLVVAAVNPRLPAAPPAETGVQSPEKSATPIGERSERGMTFEDIYNRQQSIKNELHNTGEAGNQRWHRYCRQLADLAYAFCTMTNREQNFAKFKDASLKEMLSFRLRFDVCAAPPQAGSAPYGVRQPSQSIKVWMEDETRKSETEDVRYVQHDHIKKITDEVPLLQEAMRAEIENLYLWTSQLIEEQEQTQRETAEAERLRLEEERAQQKQAVQADKLRKEQEQAESDAICIREFAPKLAEFESSLSALRSQLADSPPVPNGRRDYFKNVKFGKVDMVEAIDGLVFRPFNGLSLISVEGRMQEPVQQSLHRVDDLQFETMQFLRKEYGFGPILVKVGDKFEASRRDMELVNSLPHPDSNKNHVIADIEGYGYEVEELPDQPKRLLRPVRVKMYYHSAQTPEDVKEDAEAAQKTRRTDAQEELAEKVRARTQAEAEAVALREELTLVQTRLQQAIDRIERQEGDRTQTAGPTVRDNPHEDQDDRVNSSDASGAEDRDSSDNATTDGKFQATDTPESTVHARQKLESIADSSEQIENREEEHAEEGNDTSTDQKEMSHQSQPRLGPNASFTAIQLTQNAANRGVPFSTRATWHAVIDGEQCEAWVEWNGDACKFARIEARSISAQGTNLNLTGCVIPADVPAHMKILKLVVKRENGECGWADVKLMD